VFRRGTTLYSDALGREVKASEACFGASEDLLKKLWNAVNVPKDPESKKVRFGKLPAFFSTWVRTAWIDLLASLPSEETSDEVSEHAAEEFANRIAAGLRTLQSFGRQIQNTRTHNSETDVQRRTLVSWCMIFAKEGDWAQIRSLDLWTRLAPDGRLEIALRPGLFDQVGRKDFADISYRTFRALCEQYDLGKAIGDDGKRCRPCGANAIQLSPHFVAELTAGVHGCTEESPTQEVDIGRLAENLDPSKKAPEEVLDDVKNRTRPKNRRSSANWDGGPYRERL
jgi:hypothetical protein